MGASNSQPEMDPPRVENDLESSSIGEAQRVRSFAGKLTTGHRERGVLADGAVVAFGRAVESLMAHRSDAGDHLEASLAADPQLAVAHLLRGFALRTLGRRDLRPGIYAALASAKNAMDELGSGDRELALYEALGAWLEGRGFEAADALDRQLQRNPHDLLLIKLAHAVRFMLGDSAGMFQSLKSVLPAFDEQVEGFGFVLGCRAFALEENGELAAAEAAARRGLELEPRDAWGVHALTHVFYERGDAKAGATWLAADACQLKGLNNFAGHLSWHEALFHIELGRPASAVDLYDRRIAIYPPRDYRDFSNASSLLCLLEGRGFDLAVRWKSLAARARERLSDHGSAFADIHYVLALVASGRPSEAGRFVESMRRHSQSEQASQARDQNQDVDAAVIAEVGIPVAEAMIAAASGQPEHARKSMQDLGRQTQRLGGSRAQRRVLGWALRDQARTDRRPTDQKSESAAAELDASS